MDDFAQEGLNHARNAGNIVVGKAKRAVATVGKVAGSAISKGIMAVIKALLALIVKLLPFILIALAAILLIALIWHWQTNERGTRSALDLDPDHENVYVLNDEGAYEAVALNEEQAYINAWYKYMACSSYVKTVDGKDVLTFRRDTRDFAGLQDYYEKENYFYLSPGFIKAADDTLNKGEFLYPEQLIASIPYEMDSEGHVHLTPIMDENSELQVHSHVWQGEDLSKKSKTETEAGVWDYGFGSVLQYGAYQKQKYIDCEYTGYQLDIDVWVTEYDSDGEVTGGHYEHVGNVDVNIPTGATADEVVAQYHEMVAAYSGEDIRVTGPDVELLRKWVEECHHIDMWCEGKDVKIGAKTFEDPARSAFANNGATHYPISIPLVESAALFSGDIVYSYQDSRDEAELNPVDRNAAKEIITDTARPIDRIWAGQSPCGATEFWVARKGKAVSITPMQTSEQGNPVGAEYLRAYAENYKTYVPETVSTDYTFASRVDKDLEANSLLKALGLLVPYSTVNTGGANYDVFSVTGLTAEDFNSLLEGTPLAGSGSAWVGAEGFGVNGIFAIAVAARESGLGTSTLAASKNNYFGISDGHGGLYAFSSTYDAAMNFARLISTSQHYNGKSIDEISLHYCTADPTGWAQGVKTFMSSYYGKIPETTAINAVALRQTHTAIGKMAAADPVAVADAIEQSGYERDELYQNASFDVLSATTMLQGLVDPEEYQLSWYDKFFVAVADAIGEFFTIMTKTLPSYALYNGRRIEFSPALNRDDVDAIVIQALTYTTGELYSSIASRVDLEEDLGFLFVGKEAMFGFGTMRGSLTLIPGVGTTIDGFISPTEDYYQVLTPWSQAAGGVALAMPTGTNVLSVADGGRVAKVTGSESGGYTVVIDYAVGGNSYRITLGNLSSVRVSVGMTVNSGDVVGKSGANADGNASLFFGFIDETGACVDPLSYFYQPTYANSAIVNVALSQLGNVGGYTYKNWYPLDPMDAWCASFVSWCANQLGYIDSGVFPKFCGCTYCIDNYLSPKGLFWSNRTSGTYVPQAGDLIFFDWEQDGRCNHVGIVQYYENGVVHTVEGNSSNMVREKEYQVTSPQIFGYGLLDYSTAYFK